MESVFKIAKLQGEKTMQRWKEDMKSIFITEDMWEVVIGEDLKPDPSSTKDLKAWERTNNCAIALLILSIEDGPRAHVLRMDYIHDVWNKLIKMYGTSDLATRDQAIYQISRIDSEDFRSLSEYAEYIKKHAKTLDDMGFGLPQWLLSTFFRLGLKEGLEPYAFQMIQTARNNKMELNIDDLTIALVEYDKRVSQ